ncbi:MAG: hypothetical protein ABI203_03770 [Mucilaginibacter sp.]
MELKVDVGFEQLLQAIKQLPADKIDRIKTELSIKKFNMKSSIHTFDFQQLLLSGPVMDDDQYKVFKENRKRLNKWRTK